MYLVKFSKISMCPSKRMSGLKYFSLVFFARCTNHWPKTVKANIRLLIVN